MGQKVLQKKEKKKINQEVNIVEIKDKAVSSKEKMNNRETEENMAILKKLVV